MENGKEQIEPVNVSGLSQREIEELEQKLQEQQNHHAELAVTAMLVRDYYTALVEQGFSKEEAIKLTIGTVQFLLAR